MRDKHIRPPLVSVRDYSLRGAPPSPGARRRVFFTLVSAPAPPTCTRVVPSVFWTGNLAGGAGAHRAIITALQPAAEARWVFQSRSAACLRPFRRLRLPHSRPECACLAWQVLRSAAPTALSPPLRHRSLPLNPRQPAAPPLQARHGLGAGWRPAAEPHSQPASCRASGGGGGAPRRRRHLLLPPAGSASPLCSSPATDGGACTRP